MRASSQLICCLALTSCASGLHRADAEVAITTRMLSERAVLVVPGRLGDAPTSWALDTGASAHVISLTQADQRGLHAEPGGPRGLAYDQAGDAIVTEFTAPIAVSIFPGPRPPATPLARMRGLADLDAAQIVGIVSPQRLIPGDGAIELDLRAGALRRSHGAAARRGLARGVAVRACRVVGDGSVPTVAATIDGRPVDLLLDTGAAFTGLYADTPAAALAGTRATSHVSLSVLSGELDVAIVPSAELRLAAVTRSLRLVILPRSSASACDTDGWLGLDALAGCTLRLDRSGGALTCAAAPTRDTAPMLARLAPLAAAPPLAPHAAAPPPGVLARLGCELVREADAARLARERDLPAAEAKATAVRAGVIAALADELTVVITDEAIDRAIADLQAQHGDDEASFAARLAALHIDPAAYRVVIAEQLRELAVSQRVSEATDPLVARAYDRLTRVVVTGAGAACREQWPAYYLEQIEFTGLSSSDAPAVRLAAARQLNGGTLSLAAAGVLPASFVAAVTAALPGRTLTASESGRTLRVELGPDAAPQR